MFCLHSDIRGLSIIKTVGDYLDSHYCLECTRSSYDSVRELDETVYVRSVIEGSVEAEYVLSSDFFELYREDSPRCCRRFSHRRTLIYRFPIRHRISVVFARPSFCSSTFMISRDPSSEDARDVDLIIMPTHGRRGLKRFLLGSTTERVVRRADIPVLTLKPNGESVTYPFHDVLVPTDGSDCAREAFRVRVEIAETEVAALHLLSAITTASLGVDIRSDIQLATLEENAKTILEDASAFAEDAGVDPVAETVETGPSIHQAICAYIEEHDINLVVGTHGRTGFDRYLLGSVTEHLIRTSTIPVLTVREAPSEA